MNETQEKVEAIDDQIALINSVLNVAVQNKNFLGTYLARRTGNATVLTANCAHFGRRYALFKTEQGVLVYVPLSEVKIEV